MDFAKLLQNEETAQWVKRAVAKLAPYPYLADIIDLLSTLLIGSVLAALLFFLVERNLLRFYHRHCELSSELRRCIRKMAVYFVSCLPVYMVAYGVWIDGIHEWVAILTVKVMEGLFILCLTLTLTYGIRTFGLWYKQHSNAELCPIDGLLTVSIIFIWIGAIIIFVSLILNKTPLYLLSGLGAVAAGLLVFFQPTIVSLAVSVQLNAERLVKIGDWIVMESNDVNGVITEITLHTVKVRNWDRTLVCMPVSELVSKSFINYTHMQKGGGRRIKRAILIDQRSVRFLSMEEVEKLKEFDLLKDYLEKKQAELASYNAGRTQFNTRYLTNLGTFRVYAENYLQQCAKVRRDMPLMVRELPPDSQGVGLEFYCFTTETTWIPFEKVQSDILEHLLAILPNFRLRVFQECSDIYQEIGNQIDVVGGAFRFDHLKNPVYPDNSAEKNS